MRNMRAVDILFTDFWHSKFILFLFMRRHFFCLLKEYVNEMESVESSLKQMGENVSAVQATAVPGLASWGQDKLNKCQDGWDLLSKKV